MTIPRVAVLTPCYNEAAALPAYLEAVERTLLRRTDIEFHVLLIDDGSSDRTWGAIEAASRSSPRIRGLRLSRNFGSHAAETAGFDYIDADAVATLAADLQDPPETILEFVEAWRRGAQIVWGKRISRGDRRWRILMSAAFLHAISRFAMPRGSQMVTGGFLLVDRKVVECLRSMREHNRVVFGLVAWTGFTQVQVEYHRGRRLAGKSRFGFARQIHAVYDTFIGFSRVLPRIITLFGATFSIIGFFSTIIFFINVFITPPMVLGWSSIMITITLFSGITFFMLGVMSEYLSRIYIESTRRPIYFVAAETPPQARTDPAS
jgi:glycosyltransferase involved in cell wall biosynthesis